MSACNVVVPGAGQNIPGYEGPVEWVFEGTLAAGASGELLLDVKVE